MVDIKKKSIRYLLVLGQIATVSLCVFQTTAHAIDSNNQCKHGRIWVNGKCQDPPNGCGVSDTDCPGSMVCINHKCVEPSLDVTPHPHQAAPTESISDAVFIPETPLPGTEVGHVTTVRGTFTRIDRTKFYRTVVRPHSLDNYHPQSGTLVFEGNTFKGTTYIGPRDGGIGESFDLLIVASSPEVDEQFRTYLRTAARIGWVGMANLPPGAAIVLEVKGLLRR